MKRLLLAAALTAATALPLAAQEDVAATRADIEATFGRVPTFIDAVATPALPGLWAATRDLQFQDTALDVKTKALISLAVAAQIPCSYCIWSDTSTARMNGATDDEIAEAVAVAAETRAWSTIFNGMQVDLAQFKADLAGD